MNKTNTSITEAEAPEILIGRALKKAGLTLSAAESCTGGQISHLITTVSGSSSYYLGSVTSYAISVKEKVLGVPSSIIEEHGVVSCEVAAAMAEGVRRLTGSDYSVATTGFAGPGGGDEHYPEGTVCIAASSEMGTDTLVFHSESDRKTNIEAFAVAALEFLLKKINSEVNR